MKLFKTPIIIDNGSYSIKVGFAGENRPREVILNMYGYPKFRNWGIPDVDNPIIIPYPVGDIAYDFKDDIGYYKLGYPMDNRIIGDFNHMENIWNYIFKERLKINPSEHPFLITNPTLNARGRMESIARIFFETFKAPMITLLNSEPLALLAAGRKTGVVIDMGYHLTSIVPIYEIYPMVHAFEKIKIGGSRVKEIIKRYFRARKDLLFADDGYRENWKILEAINRHYTYVSSNLDIHDNFLKRTEADEIVNIEGVDVPLGEERFLGPEAYFHPEFMGYEDAPLPQVIVQSIENCDEDIKDDLYQNIVLSGGGSCIKGFKERLELELGKLVDNKFRLIAPLEREFLTWLGGSKLINEYSDSLEWCTSEDYEKAGEGAIHKSHISFSNE